tara:strand:- start:459 stop:686 length:228 start_codon:yes stop_codon:yes gene_type:complete
MGRKKKSIKISKKEYHRNYYRKNREKILARQKIYEKKKLDLLNPNRKKLNKPYLFKNTGLGGFKRLTGTFKVYFN